MTRFSRARHKGSAAQTGVPPVPHCPGPSYGMCWEPSDRRPSRRRALQAWYPALPAHVTPARCDGRGEVNFDAFFQRLGPFPRHDACAGAAEIHHLCLKASAGLLLGGRFQAGV